MSVCHRMEGQCKLREAVDKQPSSCLADKLYSQEAGCTLHTGTVL